MDENLPMKKVEVDLEELVNAMSQGGKEGDSYLDKETGAILEVTPDMTELLEEVLSYIPQDKRMDAQVVKTAVEGSGFQDWEKEGAYEVYLCKSDTGKRYIRIPQMGSSRGFQEMEEFVAKVTDTQVRYQLRQSLRGQKPFRQFKDALQHYPKEKTAWAEFHSANLNRTAEEWLATIGIEPA
jgi:hypothetical protein